MFSIRLSDNYGCQNTCLRVDPLKDTAGSPFGKALSVPAWSKCTYQTLSALSAFTTLCGVLTSLEKTLPIFMNVYALLTALGEPLQAFTMAKKRHWDPARICKISTTIHKPLQDTNCIYQTSTMIHKTFWDPNCTCRTSNTLHNPSSYVNCI